MSPTRTMVFPVNAAPSSILLQFVEERLGTTLTKWLTREGLKGAPVRTIAARLYAETGLTVGKSTVHDWLKK